MKINQEHKIIMACLSILATMCAANENKIIDLLTRYLWDEEEAAALKKWKGEN